MLARRWLWYVHPPAAKSALTHRVARGRAALGERRFDDAARDFGEALHAARSAYGRDDRRVIEPLSGIAAALAAAGRLEESARFAAQVVGHADAGGLARSAALVAYRDAATLYWKLGRLRASLEMWERVEASSVDRSEHAALHACSVLQQAIACRWLGRLDRVRALAQRLPREWAAMRAVVLARAAHLEGSHAEAIAGYEEARRTMPSRASYRDAPRCAEGHTGAAIVGSRLAVSLLAAGRRADAERERQRAIGALAQLGEDHDRAASIVLFDAGELEIDPRAAIAHHRRALELRRSIDGATDPLTLESRLRVAELEAEVGDRSHAAHEGRALRPLFERGVGRSHPWAMQARALAPY